MEQGKLTRVIVYIDGFNLYFGMKEAGLECCKWLDVVKLSHDCLKPNQELSEVKYFTSNLTNDQGKEKRQRTYLDAITAKGAKIIRGKYERKLVECEDCSWTWYRSNEKQTDVNIATELIMDAVKDKYDIAVLISGDSDLVPAIKAVNESFKPKYVTVVFPPTRRNETVANAAQGSYPLGRKRLQDAQMDETVISLSGYKLEKPNEWKVV